MWQSVLILTVACVLYALFHSLTAATSLKQWGQRRFGAVFERGYRLFYNFVSLVTVLPILVLMVQLPDRILYAVPLPWSWLLRFGQGLALIGLGATLLQTNLWHFAGLAQLSAAAPERSGPLVVRGFYSWMRHPLYLFSMAVLWLNPTLTANLLTVNLLASLYFYVGSIHEESRLRQEFGVAYRAYQQQVPRFLPRPGRRWQG